MLASLSPPQQALSSYRTLKQNVHYISNNILISQADSSAQGSESEQKCSDANCLQHRPPQCGRGRSILRTATS